MLPSLSGLRVDGVCRPCNTPTNAVLPTWGDREDRLTPEELARIPASYNTARAECVICFGELREPSPEDDESREVIVAVDSVGSCGHAFHKKCLQRWFDGQVARAGTLSCPLCKQPFLDKKIDELYQRVNGARPRRARVAPAARVRVRPHDRPHRRPRVSHPRHPIPGFAGLVEDAYIGAGPLQGFNMRLVLLERTPLATRIQIPDNRRNDWTVYAHQEFCHRLEIDPDRLTLGMFLQIIALPIPQQDRWLRYHILVSSLRAIARDAPRAAAVVYGNARDSVVAIARDVQNARAQGASWREVVMALALALGQE
jgi:hypothetical protein